MNTAKLKNSAVNSSKLASGGVQAADLGSGAVTAAKLANNAVTAAKIAGGAVGTNALASGAVDAAKLGNGAVTTDKLGANAVTGAKIAGATITAANIAPGQVVKGGGNFVTGRLLVEDGQEEMPVLTLPGVGQLRATCVAGVTTIIFFNQAGPGIGAAVTAWGVNDAAAVSQSETVANDSATGFLPDPVPVTPNVLGLTYQVVSTANPQQVTTADISAAPAAPGNCAVVASGLTTG